MLLFPLLHFEKIRPKSRKIRPFLEAVMDVSIIILVFGNVAAFVDAVLWNFSSMLHQPHVDEGDALLLLLLGGPELDVDFAAGLAVAPPFEERIHVDALGHMT